METGIYALREIFSSISCPFRDAMEASGNLIDFNAGEVDNNSLEITATVRLGGKGVRADRVLSEHLATGVLRLKVNRKALYVDRAGTLYSPLTGFRARIA